MITMNFYIVSARRTFDFKPVGQVERLKPGKNIMITNRSFPHDPEKKIDLGGSRNDKCSRPISLTTLEVRRLADSADSSRQYTNCRRFGKHPRIII